MASYQRELVSKGIYIDFVNGHKKHCHALVSLGSNQTIEKIAQFIKGEFSFRINKNFKFNGKKFEWLDEYFAVSILNQLQITSGIISKIRKNIIEIKPFRKSIMNLLKDCDFKNLKVDDHQRKLNCSKIIMLNKKQF